MEKPSPPAGPIRVSPHIFRLQVREGKALPEARLESQRYGAKWNPLSDARHYAVDHTSGNAAPEGKGGDLMR